MAIAGEAEGWAEALRRIAACRKAQAEELDLSGLRLTRVPEEVCELAWLRRLYLGADAKAPNALSTLHGALFTVLTELELLDLAHNGLRDLPVEVAGLVNLTSLNLSGNEIGPDGARVLSALVNLTSLNLSGNSISASGAQALKPLVNLTTLNLSSNEICPEGAQALRGLTSLTSLNLDNNQIGLKGVRALRDLTGLLSLDLSTNNLDGDGELALEDLNNLTSLTSLRLFNNFIGPDGAQGLAGLVNLTSLDLNANCIGTEGARALKKLFNLTSLGLDANGVGDGGVQALKGLVNLTSLELGGNGIGAEGAITLKGFTKITTLDLGRGSYESPAKVDNCIGPKGAQALQGLVDLTALDLSHSGVKDLSPLLSLRKLEKLNCSGCHLDDRIPALWAMPSLREVMLHQATLPGVPAEVLSPDSFTSCLETLRAHFEDLAAGEAEMIDVKLMILGNGRVGKTQLCRRLRGEPYDDTVPSTHGIQISSAPLTPGEPPLATLRIWDFGGQDIYHGTHALFLRSRAIFPLVWTPLSEETQFHDHGGFTFRNQPLGYWLAYVRAMGGRDPPLLIIQSQCDRPEDEREAPVDPFVYNTLPYKKRLHFSAKADRGQAALNEGLADAVVWLRRGQGVDKIGKGRANVKARLEKMQEEDGARPAAERRHRLLTQAEFLDLCEKAGNISSPDALLDYLHNCGTVFYRRGLFGDRIILDQAWALDAVYAVFDRKRSYKNLQRYRGRFTRSDLGQWVWDADGHDAKEQELFLSLMQQCGICFRLRRGDDARNIEAEYIAPDLLPGRVDAEIAAQLQQKWEPRFDAEATLVYQLLPPGLLRALISNVGSKAGLAAEYWRDGFYFYDQETHSKALVEQRWTVGWAGEIRIETQHGQAQVLIERVLKLIDNLHDRFGARPSDQTIPAHQRLAERNDGPDQKDLIKPAPEPSAGNEYYVSYAWGDDLSDEGRQREADVDRLCAQAGDKGIVIIRDKTAMKLGDRISEFMTRVGRGDRVFIVLSDKYLQSAYCMHELFEVWRNCKEEDTEFIARTRVFALPSAKIGTVAERARYVVYWRKRFEETETLVKEHGLSVLADADIPDHRRMSRFVHETANILKLVQDVLRPRTFDEFLKYGLDDPS